MTEKFPLPSRPEPKVIGPVSEERKKELQQEIVGNFQDNRAQITEEKRLKLPMVEYPKQDFEKIFIADTNQLLNEILSAAGVKTFDIPEENIYIVPDKTYKEIDGEDEGGNGMTIHSRQSIVINAEELAHPILRSKVLLHEMIHLKNFLSIEAPDEKQHWLRRIGLEMQPTEKKENEIGYFLAFSGLNEAVVSTLEKRSFPQLIEKNPALRQEEQTLFASEKQQARRKEIAEKENVEEDDVAYVSQNGEEWMLFAYPEHRKVLDYIITTLYQENPSHFASEDDVFKLFLQAHYGGQLLPLARALKSTFGEDAFRILSMMDATSKNSARQVMDYFQKKGGRVKKEHSQGAEEKIEKSEA